MNRIASARIAGIAYLVYIAVALPSTILLGRATGGEGVAAKLESIARHASDVHLAQVLSLVGCFCALVLGVTLYAVTRDENPDVALLGLTSRAGEGIIGAISLSGSRGLLWLATATGASAPDLAGARAIGAFLLSGQGSSALVGATFFAVGSTCFSWLLLRGRMIPDALAWIGVIASVLLVVALPLQIAGVIPGSVAQFLWLPMAAFEIPLGVWLLAKGVAPVRERRPA